MVEAVRAVAARIGADRVGLRLSPGGQFNDMHDRGNEETYLALVDELEGDGVGYLHTLRGRTSTLHVELRRRWSSTYVVNTGYMGSSELDVLAPIVEAGEADLVSVGRLFISNPDLVARWRNEITCASWDEDTFYTGGDRGLHRLPERHVYPNSKGLTRSLVDLSDKVAVVTGGASGIGAACVEVLRGPARPSSRGT